MTRQKTLALTFVVLCALISGGVWLGVRSSAHGQGSSKTSSSLKHRLGIEIGLSHMMKVSTPDAQHMTEVFLQVPAKATGTSLAEGFSAIKVMPRMIGNKLRVKVSVLYGDTSGIKTCDDWGALKEAPIRTYTLGEGEEATVSELSNLGPNFKAGMLTFKAISLLEEESGGGCACSTCDDGSTCCVNPGHCMTCGTCGTVCCRKCPETRRCFDDEDLEY